MLMLSEKDRLQGALYKAQARAARAELALAEFLTAAWNARVAREYVLSQGDSVDLDSGQIWRALASEPPPADLATPTTPTP